MSDSAPSSDMEVTHNGQTETPAKTAEETPQRKTSWLETDQCGDAKTDGYNSSNGKDTPPPEILAPDTPIGETSASDENGEENVIPDSQPLKLASQEDVESVVDPQSQPSVSLLASDSPIDSPVQKEDVEEEEKEDKSTPIVEEVEEKEKSDEPVATPIVEEPMELKNHSVCGTSAAGHIDEEKPAATAVEPPSEEETEEKTPKPKRGRWGKGTPKTKKSFEESLLSADETAQQPVTPGNRRGRSQDVSKTEETKSEGEEEKPDEAAAETAHKRPTRTRHPVKPSSPVPTTPRALRTRGHSESAVTPKETPTKRKADATTSASAKKPAKRGRKKAGSDDPYDFDLESDSDKTPIGPLRHVSVARTNFGDLKFTKAVSSPLPAAKGKVAEVASSKYVNTSKAVEQRQQTTSTPASVRKARAMADTLPLSDSSDSEVLTPPPLYRVTVREEHVIEKLNPNTNCVIKRAVAIREKGTKLQNTLTPELKKQISPDDAPSSGTMADISSSSGSAATISQIGHQRYLDKPENVIAKDSPAVGKKKSPRQRGRPKRTADVSLFSDVPMEEFQRDEEKGDHSGLSEDEEAEEEMAEKTPPTSTKPSTSATPSSSARKRGRTPKESPREPPPLLEKSTKRRRTANQVLRPPTPEYTLPSSAEEQMGADFPEGSHATFIPGCRVMARWVDKEFYPGNIIHRDGLGRYKVRFIDGNFRDMPPADVIPVSQLKVGDQLMVWIKEFGADEELQPVKITKTPDPSDSDEWFGGIYEVENKSAEAVETVSWEKFVIDKEQTKNFIKTVVNKAAQDIVADNILSEKRERRSRISVPSEVSSTPPPSPPPTTGRRGRKSAAGGSGVAKTKGTPRAKAERKKPVGRKSVGEDSSQGTDTDVSSIVQCSPPVAGEMPNIFEGKKFILTSANRRPPRSTDGDTPEDDRATVPFYKRQVRQMIEDRGGVVVDDFSQEATIENCILVADTHYRTHKYLSALARAVPCVSHMWIYNSCTEGQLLSFTDFTLPAGLSLEAKSTVPWHSECPTLLKDLSVFVYTHNNPTATTALDFVQIWSPLVKCMGATVVTEMPAKDSRLDYLLTDASCPQKVLAEAEGLGASAVSSEWLIQAIITGKKPDPKAHKKYKYDFVETTSSSTE